MSKKTRYLLIFFCFLVFVLLSPAIVIYVQGLSYDFQSGKFFKTGILAARVEPDTAEIWLDNTLKKEGEGNIKFLKPGEYNVKISKPGFFDWSKRLQIYPNEVTWINPANSKIYLFLKEPPIQTLTESVSDLQTFGQNIYALKGQTLKTGTWQDGFKNSTDLNHSFTKILKAQDPFLILAAEKENLSNQFFLFDLNSKQIFDLSEFITTEKEAEQLIFKNNKIYSIQSLGLYEIDWQLKTKILQIPNAKAAFFTNSDLYFLTQTATSTSLLVKNQISEQGTNLPLSLPQTASAEIFVNNQKEVFLFLDQDLYKLADQPKILEKNIGLLLAGKDNPNTIILLSSGELKFYDDTKKELKLVTRSSLKINNPVFRPTLDYLFLNKENSLYAIELDNRDKQNEFLLYQALGDFKFFIDSEGKNALVLDGTEIKKVKIR